MSASDCSTITNITVNMSQVLKEMNFSLVAEAIMIRSYVLFTATLGKTHPWINFTTFCFDINTRYNDGYSRAAYSCVTAMKTSNSVKASRQTVEQTIKDMYLKMIRKLSTFRPTESRHVRFNENFSSRKLGMSSMDTFSRRNGKFPVSDPFGELSQKIVRTLDDEFNFVDESPLSSGHQTPVLETEDVAQDPVIDPQQDAMSSKTLHNGSDLSEVGDGFPLESPDVSAVPENSTENVEQVVATDSTLQDNINLHKCSEFVEVNNSDKFVEVNNSDSVEDKTSTQNNDSSIEHDSDDDDCQCTPCIDKEKALDLRISSATPAHLTSFMIKNGIFGTRERNDIARALLTPGKRGIDQLSSTSSKANRKK